MFKSSNFCHIASNNRNNVKAGVFVYRTTDDLATVSASGYFNERIIDINLHDLIIHEKIDATDKTKVEKNLLCVIEKTLENITTIVIQSDWEKEMSSWLTSRSNCLTAIPQDIKLELSNGTLTHAVGSKFYTPDGTAHTVSTSSSVSTASSDGQHFVYCAGSSGNLQSFNTSSLVSRAGSGSSLPADNTDYSVFLNTSDSKIYHYTGGAWSEWAVGLPLAIITVVSGVITSIDQVFNGFGYIGSTVFALPGVKGLAPNGRNEDGTLKTREIESLTFITRTFTETGDFYIGIQNTGIGITIKDLYKYDAVKNIQYSNNIEFSNSVIIGSCTLTSGAISNWSTKTVFHAFDYGDFLKYAFVANKGTTLRNIQERFGDIINIKDFGAVGDGVTDDTNAFNAAIDSITSTGNILVPAGNYVVTIANIDLQGKTINYILTDDATISDNIPGAVFKSGVFTLPETSIQNDRNCRIHQYVDVGNSVAGANNIREYGIHVHGVVPEDGIATYTDQEFRAFSYDVESQKDFDNASVYGIKGRVFGNGGNANLRSMYAFAEANNGFTGNLTGLLATIYKNGQSVADSVGVRVHVSDGVTSGVQVGGAGSDLGGAMSFCYSVRTGTGQPGMPTVAAYAAHGGGTGDIFIGYKSNTELTVDDAPYRVTNKGVVKAQTHCTNNISIADDGVAIIDLGFNSYDGIIKFYVRQTLQTWGEIYYRVYGNAAATEIYSGSLVDITQGVVLTGTTGTDGNLTISATNDGKLYIENRLGAAKVFVYDIMSALS